MATVKSSINGNDHHYVVGVDPRPILRPRRCNTPLNNPYSTLQSILPDIPSRKSHSKKRVRFALTLESIEEDPLRSYPISIEIKTKKQIADTWHNDGPLYDTYVEYIQNKETSSSTTTTTYVFPKSKPSDSIVESVNIPLPPIVERTKKIQQEEILCNQTEILVGHSYSSSITEKTLEFANKSNTTVENTYHSE